LPTAASELSAIPQTMHAAVYRGASVVDVEEIPTPRIGPGEILIRVEACGICHTDLKKIEYNLLAPPRVYGHETAGVVAAVGSGVTKFQPGDRVVAFHHIPCRSCFYCQRKIYAQCAVYKKVGITAGFEPAGGGFAQYVRVMDWIVEGGVIAIPEGVPFEQAAFVEPVNTCYKAVQLLNLQPDETVLVMGQGPIGILLAALAKRTGATVLTSDLYAERHAIARKFGLDRPILVSGNAARGDVVAAAKSATEGRGADVAMVAVGADALIKTAMDAVRPGGRVMLFASTQHGEAGFDPAAVCMDEKTLMGSYSASVDVNDEVAELVFAGYHDGSFDLTQLISHRFGIEDAVKAIDMASHPQADSMKIVIKP